MAIQTGDDVDADVMGVINTTPLVDVMLVLLIIFLITIPVVTTSVKVDLPKEANQARQAKPDNVIISVDRNGQIFLFDTPVKQTRELVDRLQRFAALSPQPEVHIRGDQQTDFEHVGSVIQAIQRAGIMRVGFVTDPSGL